MGSNSCILEPSGVTAFPQLIEESTPPSYEEPSLAALSANEASADDVTQPVPIPMVHVEGLPQPEEPAEPVPFPKEPTYIVPASKEVADSVHTPNDQGWYFSVASGKNGKKSSFTRFSTRKEIYCYGGLRFLKD